MAGNESSEEKSLPASPKKLRDLRKKGDVPKSSDMVTAVSFTLGILYLLTTASDFFSAFKDAFNNRRLFDGGEDVFKAALIVTKSLAYGVGPFLILLVIIVIASTIIANIVLNKGVVFAIDKIKFDLNKLNFFEGIKRIFALRNLIELAKTTLKLAIFVTAVVLVVKSHVRAPFLIPECGVRCFHLSIYYVITAIILISIVVFLSFGFVDIFVQQWLFLRDQKMTKTEAKKDRKDQEGSPEIKSSRRRARNQLLQRSSKDAQAPATIIIEGDVAVVGMRFVRFETPLPIVVSKGAGRLAGSIVEDAMNDKIPIHFNDQLATQLFRRLEIGAPLPEQFFGEFIQALRAAGQI
jgi:type III secretion protein U